MIFVIIVGMALVTMIPRAIPAFIVDKLQLHDWVNRWLNAIPFAALGALIFPGILSVKPDQPYIGLLGGLVAAVLACFGLNVVIAVMGAIVTVFLFSI